MLRPAPQYPDLFGMIGRNSWVIVRSFPSKVTCSCVGRCVGYVLLRIRDDFFTTNRQDLGIFCFVWTQEGVASTHDSLSMVQALSGHSRDGVKEEEIHGLLAMYLNSGSATCVLRLGPPPAF